LFVRNAPADGAAAAFAGGGEGRCGGGVGRRNNGPPCA